MSDQSSPSDRFLPSDISGQNGEEQPGDDEQVQNKRSPAETRSDDASGGESSEGTQSTGSPTSAG